MNIQKRGIQHKHNMYTTDPTNKRLSYGVDDEKVPQNEVYLILSEEERAKGFVRPCRDSYIHKGVKYSSYSRLKNPEKSMDEERDYVALFDILDLSGNHVSSRYATQDEINEFDRTGHIGGCGVETKMTRELSETYAAKPNFYDSTYCVGCHRHIYCHEFVWSDDGKIVGS